jgi:hypothetical protein
VVNLLRQRELSSHEWPPGPPHSQDPTRPGPSAAIADWLESDFLSHCSAAYCPLGPPPRSTIAIAFSPDGSLLASTQYAFPASLHHKALDCWLVKSHGFQKYRRMAVVWSGCRGAVTF